MVGTKQPDGAIKRGLRMGRLAATLTGSYLGYQFQNLMKGELDQGRRKQEFNKKASKQIRKELESLKGPVMKLGQALSTQGVFLPEEALDELASLQMHAPPMHPTLARTQFKNSFGKFPENVFREFSREPFASASLGQAHRAVTKSRDLVAVKIQYPAIQTAVRNDFKLLRTAVAAGQLSEYFTNDILDELETRISIETDYRLEAKNLSFFKRKLKPLSFVQVPRPFTSFSTDRILTMSLLDGQHLDDWLNDSPSQRMRDKVGARLFELFYFQLFKVRMLHADPHPGNYLFTKDGSIGLIDFGCVKEIDSDVLEFSRMFEMTHSSSDSKTIDSLTQLLWSNESNEKQGEIHKILEASFRCRDLIHPVGKPLNYKVNFGDTSIFTELTELLKIVFESKLHRPQPLFVKRAEMGLYNMLHKLKARVNTRRIMNKLVH